MRSRERRLEHAAVDRILVGRRLTRGHVDERAAVLLEHRRHLSRLLRLEASRHPVVGRDAHVERLLARPDLAHGIEDLERVAHAVLERAAVVVLAPVGHRGDEARQQIPVRHVELEHVEAGLDGHPGRGHEGVAHRDHVLARHLPWHLVLRPVGDRRRRHHLPVARFERLVGDAPTTPAWTPCGPRDPAGLRSRPWNAGARSR